MTEYSMLWTTSTTGDGGVAGYTQDQTTGLFHRTLISDLTDEGVLKNYANALGATPNNDPAAPDVTIDTGGAWNYGFPYWQDAAQDVALTLPVVGDTGFRIVLRASYAPTRTVRLTVVMNTDGVAAIPALTQVADTTWDIPLYQGVVDTGGDIWTDATKTVAGVTDDRVYCHPNIEVETTMLQDSAVTAAKIANRTRSFFVPAVGGYNDSDGLDLEFYTASDPGSGRGLVLTDAKTCLAFGFFAIPHDFVSGMTVAALLLTETSGKVYCTPAVVYGANGENVVTHSDTNAASAIGITSGKRNLIASVTITAAASGDLFEARFTRTGGDALDTVGDEVRIAGWLVSYTADS